MRFDILIKDAGRKQVLGATSIDKHLQKIWLKEY